MRFSTELFFLFVFVLMAIIGKKGDNDFFSISNSTQMKGIASILILIGHSLPLTQFPQLGFLNCAWYCVGLFFFWSGYGVVFGYLNKDDYLNGFIISRFIRVAIPFLCIHLIYIPVKIAFGINYSLLDYVKSLLGFSNIVDNAWFPSAVMVFYILFFIVFSQKIYSTNVKLVILFIGVVILTIIECFIFVPRQSTWWVISNLPFAIGAIMATIILTKKRKIYLFVLMIFTFLVGYAGMRFFKGWFGHAILPENIRTAALVTIAVFLVGWINRKNKIALFLGRISYEIYLIHGLYVFILSSMLNNSLRYLILPITLLCSIPSAWILNKVNVIIINKLLSIRSLKGANR